MVKRSAVVAEPVIWRRIVVRALTVLIFFTVVFGVLYPLFITGAANLFFPHQAQGSLVEADGRIVGSELIGQDFSGGAWFESRPSATLRSIRRS